MNRRHLISFAAVLAGLMLAGCVDDSYRGIFDVDHSVDNDVPVAVTMKIGEPDDIVSDALDSPASKGSGTIVNKRDLEGKTIHIYAFNQELQTDFTVTAHQDTISCLIDGSIDDQESKMGRASVYEPEVSSVSDLVWQNDRTKPVYYPNGDYSGNNYDFFAYYLDDIEVTEDDFHRESDRIYIKGLEIDGSHDIMSSKAAPTEKQKAEIENLRITKPDWDLSFYGYHSANNTSLLLEPTFVFTHHLARLRFKLIAGDVPGVQNEVTVEKIEVESRYRGDFTVAVKGDEGNLGFVDDFMPPRKYFDLTEPDGSEYQKRTLTVSSGEVIDDLGSIMIAPGDYVYDLRITLSEKKSDGTLIPPADPLEKYIHLGKEESPYKEDKGPDTDTSPDNLKDDLQRLKAGCEYLITMTVYGQQDVRLSSTLEKWHEGGDYTYDQDEIWPE